MIRTSSLAVLGLALMSSIALAQAADRSDRPSNAPPAQLNAPDNRADEYTDSANGNDADDRAQQANNNSRALFCRRDAAARTGYVTPDEAASREQTNGSVGGTVLGAAAGAVIGSASGHAGAGALIGAGAGLVAGTAIGQDNARHAASDVDRAYADAYYACLHEADDGDPVQFAQTPPPPPYGYYGPPSAYYPYYYYPYPYPVFAPGGSFGFRFGGVHGFRGGFTGGFRGGFHGGVRHR